MHVQTSRAVAAAAERIMLTQSEKCAYNGERALTLCMYEQAFMGNSPEHGVLLVSLGTIALLGEPFFADKAHAEEIQTTL